MSKEVISEAIQQLVGSSELCVIAQEAIQLPSDTRIRQRLGEVATDAVIENNLFPKIEKLEKSILTTAELIEAIVSKIDEITHDEESAFMGTIFYASRDLPKIVNKIVGDDQKGNVLKFWAGVIEKVKENDDAKAFIRYPNRQAKIPRKTQKAIRKSPVSLTSKELARLEQFNRRGR